MNDILKTFFCFQLLLWGDLVQTTSSTHCELGYYPGITVEHCGIGKKHEIEYRTSDKPSKRIRGGRFAEFGEFPYVVGLKKKSGDHFFCTGSIIHSKWILTAAHCFKYIRPDDTLIFVGNTLYPQKTDNYYECEKVVPHPNYSSNYEDYLALEKHDIALIRLKKRIVFDVRKDYFKVNTICLPLENISNTNNESAVYSGWGDLDRREDWSPINYVPTHNRERLKTYTVNMMAMDSCSNTIDPNLIFSYHNLDRSHSNSGDSGGPVIQYVDGKAVIIGVHIGFGFKRDIGSCVTVAAVSVRVSKYIEFIKNNILNKM